MLKSIRNVPVPQPPFVSSQLMIASDEVLLVKPETSFVHAFGAVKSPAGEPASPPLLPPPVLVEEGEEEPPEPPVLEVEEPPTLVEEEEPPAPAPAEPPVPLPSEPPTATKPKAPAKSAAPTIPCPKDSLYRAISPCTPVSGAAERPA